MIRSLKEIAGDLRVKVGYTSAFIILLISYLLTLYGNNQLIKQTRWVNHTNKIINNLEILVSGVKDAETAIRGYVNTHDTSFLSPYYKSFFIVNSSFQALEQETRDNDFQQNYLDSLSAAIRSRYNILSSALYIFRVNNYKITPELLNTAYAGKADMDKVRSIAAIMQQHEQQLLQTRNKELDARYIALNTIIITSFIIAIVFAVFGFYTYRRENKARKIADSKAAESQQELQQRIVELDKANAELLVMKRSEKFLATGRVARTIAHEVRNPLTNIDLAAAQIKAELQEEHENTSMLFDMITRNSRRINELISKLLDATRFTDLSFARHSINDLLDDALELARDRLELNHIKVEKKYSTDICEISVDAEKIRIAFLNLIVNATEAMEPGKGILQLVTKGEDGKCIVTISDNGHGMSEEQLNHVFEPYFTTKTGGNGLGLTNTANIILNHKGDINVSSEPGKGTTFMIRFDFAE